MKIKKRYIIIFIITTIALFSIYHYQRKRRLKSLYVCFHYPGSFLDNMKLNYRVIFRIHTKLGRFPSNKDDLINMYAQYLDMESEKDISNIRRSLKKYQYETLNIKGEKIHFLIFDNIFKEFGYKSDIKIAWDDEGNLRTEYCGDIPILMDGKLISEPIENHLDLDIQNIHSPQH